MINTFHISTCMGKCSDKLPFLSEIELKEFNHIGYTGKNSQGVKTTREKYLNSLNKGEFKVVQTLFDNGSFEEGFMIIWVN